MRDLRGAALRLDDEQQGPRRARGNRSDAFLRGAVLHLASQYGADPEGTDPERRLPDCFAARPVALAWARPWADCWTGPGPVVG